MLLGDYSFSRNFPTRQFLKIRVNIFKKLPLASTIAKFFLKIVTKCRHSVTRHFVTRNKIARLTMSCYSSKFCKMPYYDLPSVPRGSPRLYAKPTLKQIGWKVVKKYAKRTAAAAGLSLYGYAGNKFIASFPDSKRRRTSFGRRPRLYTRSSVFPRRRRKRRYSRRRTAHDRYYTAFGKRSPEYRRYSSYYHNTAFNR